LPNTATLIKEILTTDLSPQHLEVLDESAQHAGHAQQKQFGGGHYRVRISSEAFKNKSRVEQHRLIYAALKSISDQIHALAIEVV